MFNKSQPNVMRMYNDKRMGKKENVHKHLSLVVDVGLNIVPCLAVFVEKRVHYLLHLPSLRKVALYDGNEHLLEKSLPPSLNC